MSRILRRSLQGVRQNNPLHRQNSLHHLRRTTLSTITRNPTELSIRERLALFGELSKFRLSSLVVLTTFAGFSCAGQIPLDFVTISAMTTACVGTGFCAASASTFNQVIEKNRDAVMKRTLARPLPSGKVSVRSKENNSSTTLHQMTHYTTFLIIR